MRRHAERFGTGPTSLMKTMYSLTGASRRGEEAGAVLIIVALCLVLLLGIAAIAIDGGVAYNERRSTQDVADNAALAAAWAICSGGDPVSAAKSVGVENGYSAAAFTVTTPYSQAGSSEFTVEASKTVHVTLSSDVDTTFGKTQGVDEINVLSEAVATCSGQSNASAPAIFAKGPSCVLDKRGNGDVNGLIYSANDIDIRGNLTAHGPVYAGDHIYVNGNKTFNGLVHAENTMDSNGNITFNDAVSTVNGYTYRGNTTFNGGPHFLTAPWNWNLDYPINYQVADYAPGSAKANAATAEGKYYYHSGNWEVKGNSTVASGLHYVAGNVTIKGNTTIGSSTIVATGSIEVSGNAKFGVPYVDGLSFMTSKNTGCSPAIDLSGNGVIRGIIFAPNAGIEITGNSVVGSAIGMNFSDSGNMNVTGDSSYMPAGDPTLYLLE